MLAWLDGAARREKALALVVQAGWAMPEADRLRAEAADVRAAAERGLEQVPLWAQESEKAPFWAEIDRADGLVARAELLEIEVERLLQGALGQDPDNVEARERLAERWRRAFELAEAARDGAALRRAEALWRVQVAALPAGSAQRARHEVLLRGTGALPVHTVPDGVPVSIARYVPSGRRLGPGPRRALGRTPLAELPLEAGSYLLFLEAPGGPVRLPVVLERGRTTHVAADAAGRAPLRLPTGGELGDDDVFVAAGASRLGGDSAAIGGRPGRVAWIESFILRRHPVTNAEFIAFLDDLVATGREDEALRHVPREKAGTTGQAGAMIYGRRADGGFCVRADADGDVWAPDWPVFNVDWYGAAAYAAWLAARTGKPWRLPTSDERERAGRGADGRFYPWGDVLDPSWCNMRDSRPGRAAPAVVDAFPVDESPFGVRGLAGNVRDWCADLVVGDRRINRGGFWLGNAREARLADQHDHVPVHRAAEIGFRLARSPWPSEDEASITKK